MSDQSRSPATQATSDLSDREKARIAAECITAGIAVEGALILAGIVGTGGFAGLAVGLWLWVMATDD